MFFQLVLLIQILQPVLILILISFAIVIIMFYIFLGIRDLIILLNNFNLEQADYCRFKKCSFYFFDKSSNKHKCLNPFVTITRFEKYRKTGNHKGCQSSVQPQAEKDSYEFLEYYLDLIKTFNANHMWWRIVTIIIGIVLVQLGVMSLKEIIPLIF